MEVRNHHIEYTKTGRFSSIGNNENPEIIWYVLHGYAQLSHRFIRKFSPLNLNNSLIVAPEGLHRFYINGSSGHVGASWMTKEDRLTDIGDYVHFLDQLHVQIEKHVNGSPKVVILGFSQGAATASRWLTMGNISANALILWGSVFPPDLDLKLSRDKLNTSKVLLINGDEDEYYSQEKFEEHRTYLRQNEIKFESMTYRGNHNIFPDPLLNIQTSMIFD